MKKLLIETLALVLIFTNTVSANTLINPSSIALPNGDLIIGSPTGVGGAHAITGDITLGNTGAVTVTAVGGQSAANIATATAEVTGNATTNFVFAGPAAGPAAPPSFRALVPADIPGFTPGTPNTFSYYDAGGILVTLPGWSVNTTSGLFSADVHETFNMTAGPGLQKIESFEAEVNPAVVSSLDTFAFNIDTHIDRTGSGNNITGATTALNLSNSVEGTGTNTLVNAVRVDQTFGQGLAGTTTQGQTFNVNVSAGAGYTLNDYFAFQKSLNIDPAATVGNVNEIQMNTQNGNITGNYNGVAMNFSGNIAGNSSIFAHNIFGNPNGSYRGSNLNIFGNSATDVTGYNLGTTGSIGTNYTGFSANHGGGVIGGSYNGLLLSETSNITGNYTGITLNQTGDIASWTGLNMQEGAGNSAGQVTGINMSLGAGTNTGKEAFNILMGNGNSTGSGRIMEANMGGGTYNDFIGINLNSNNVSATTFTGYNLGSTTGTLGSYTGANLQVGGTVTTDYQGLNISAQGGTTVGNNVLGINVDLQNITATGGHQKVGMDINDGELNVASNYNTSTLPPSPGFVTLNTLGGNYVVAAGFPVSNTGVIANDIGIGATFNDSMGPDALGGLLGFTDVGFISQVSVAAGKTVDTLNMMLAAGAVNAGSGTITNANMFATPGFVNSGGTLTATNLVGYRVLPGMSAFGTNTWGIKVDDAGAHNSFAGDVVVGGALPTNSSVGIEVTSTAKAILNARMTTGQRNALIAVNGMQIYNTTTSSLDCYIGGAWGSCATGSGFVTNVTATAPVVSSGGAVPNISMHVADTTDDGYLSQVDWNTFNSKLTSVLPSADIFVGSAGNVATARAVTGDVSITNTGVTTVGSVGGGATSAASIATSVALTQAATSANTPNTLVLRDGAGSFSAGTITASLTGNVTGNVSGTSANVTGTVAIGNGGTGQTTQTTGFDALSPTTTKGDLIVNNGTHNVRQAVGADTFVLTADSTQATGVKWAASGGGGGTTVYGAYVAATCSADPCTITSQGTSAGTVTWLSAVNHTGTGTYTAHFNPAFANPPYCLANDNSGGFARYIGVANISTTSVDFFIFSGLTTGGTTIDSGFMFQCF